MCKSWPNAKSVSVPCVSMHYCNTYKNTDWESWVRHFLHLADLKWIMVCTQVKIQVFFKTTMSLTTLGKQKQQEKLPN